MLSESVVSAEFPGANFQSYQTFAWQSGQRKFTERGEQRLRGTVDQELIAKGYRKAASEKDADLLIKYVGIQQRQQIQKALVTGPGSAMLIPETVDTGALRLQFVDRKNNRVVWQGDASAVVRDPRNVTEVTPAVKAILAKFPKR